MAEVHDIVKLKYCIPRVKLNVRPQGYQYYDLYYAKKPENTDTLEWTKYKFKLNIKPNGDLSPVPTLSDLEDDTTYILKFENDKDTHYSKFKTGINVALADSPYYEKILMPGQVYEWFDYELYDKLNPSDATYYYPLDNHKREVSQDENWGSLQWVYLNGNNYANIAADDKLDNTKLFNKHTDKNGLEISGTLIDNVNTFIDYPLVLAMPYLKLDETTNQYGAFYNVKNGYVYGYEMGGGGIAAYDAISMGVRFACCVEDLHSPMVDDVIPIFVADANMVRSHKAKGKIMLYFNQDGELRFYYSKNPLISSNTKDILVYNQRSLENEWFDVTLTTGRLTIQFQDGKGATLEFANADIDLSDSTLLTLYDNNYDNAVITPFLFGDKRSQKLHIARIISTGSEFDVIGSQVLQLQIEADGKTFLQESKNTTLVKKDRVGFYIDPAMCEPGGPFYNFDCRAGHELKLSIINRGKAISNKTLTGFSYQKSDGSVEHISGIVRASDYIQDSFDLDFTKAKDPIIALGEQFFTKHGTWGGYNGGVNGYNIYFNADKNLVLENHGDRYSGSTRGVSKEAVKESEDKIYTGYGFPLDLEENVWDDRTNKSCLRSGSAIVSNKYYSWGRVDITMKIPVGCWGVCPAIWLFHYIEIGDTDARFDDDEGGFTKFNKQGTDEDGYYRVVNNEIDIELPSHLTNGTINKLSDVKDCYFDRNVIDNQLTIGVVGDLEAKNGLYQLEDIYNPNNPDSWKKIATVANPRYLPSFANCKLNNWIGELNSGDSWCKPTNGEKGNVITAEDYYKGTGDYNDLKEEKEEYCSQLTHITDNLNGFADGKFHKWSIVWLPDRVELLVDDVWIRENRGFVPFNIMKLTVAGWFPTMPIDKKVEPTGVKDRDGIHGSKGAVLTNINDNATSSIGTWAGTQANWDVLHLEISRIQYERYKVGDKITFNGKTTEITAEPTTLGESFPESGLRMFVKP